MKPRFTYFRHFIHFVVCLTKGSQSHLKGVSTACDVVFPLSIYSGLFFRECHPIALYVFFPSLLLFPCFFYVFYAAGPKRSFFIYVCKIFSSSLTLCSTISFLQQSVQNNLIHPTPAPDFKPFQVLLVSP